MANTVVAIFENEFDAQKAQNYLLGNGFANGDVDIKTASYKSDGSHSDSGNVQSDEDFFTKIGHFFTDLFGDKDEEVKLYSEAGRRGTIVTVHARDTREADAAADVLDQFGAVNVKENAARYLTGQVFTEGAYSGSVIPDEALHNSTSDVATREQYKRSSPADPLPSPEQQVTLGDPYLDPAARRSRSQIFDRSVDAHIRLRQQTNSNQNIPLTTNAQDPDLQTYRDLDQTITQEQEDTADSVSAPLLTDEERLKRLNLRT